MKRYWNILFIALSILAFYACKDTKDIEDKLHKAEVYMQEHPELALEVLEDIETIELITQKVQAKHALLYSMALDKNFIDVADDSIIAPAVSYYGNHGTADDKLKTKYYLGRISMNAGKYEDAITYLIQAERYIVNCNDLVAVGLLYSAKMHIYQYLFDTEAMIAAAQKSASAFLLARDTTRYLNAINGILTGYLQQQDTLNAESYLSVFKQFWASLSLSQKSKYYSGVLFLIEDKDNATAELILQQYFDDVQNPEIIQWLPIAKTYFHLKKYDEASLAIDNYLQYGGKKNGPFYFINALVNEAKGNYQGALENYRLYVDSNGERDADLFGSDARFIEERIKAETSLIKKNYTIAIVVLTLFCVLLLIVIVGGKIKKAYQLERKQHLDKIEGVERERQELEVEKNKYIEMYNATCKDIARLRKTLQENKLDKEICKLVEERLNVLNNFVAANISGSFSKLAYDELAKLMADQTHFLNSTRASFHIAHPKFLSYLKKKGLTDDEIEYCCLYCIGLNGSEILSYLNKPSIYNISAVLRKKLDVEKKMKIDVFLQKKMQEFD